MLHAETKEKLTPLYPQIIDKACEVFSLWMFIFSDCMPLCTARFVEGGITHTCYDVFQHLNKDYKVMQVN